jgi:hypothetical protein
MNPTQLTNIKKTVIARSSKEFTGLELLIKRTLYSEPVLSGVYPLMEYVINRAARVNQLAKQGSVDDAEIILRSMLEGFMKFFYIIKSENASIYKERVGEYFGVLKDIGSIAESNRLKSLSFAKINDKYDPYSRLVMTEAQEESLKKKESWANRSYRQSTKSKWSYSKLSEHLRMTLKDGILIPFELLDHYYAEASHLVHCDEALFRNKWMEPFVGRDYLRMIQIGNMVKLLRVVTELLFWMALELLRVVGQDKECDMMLVVFTTIL